MTRKRKTRKEKIAESNKHKAQAKQLSQRISDRHAVYFVLASFLLLVLIIWGVRIFQRTLMASTTLYLYAALLSTALVLLLKSIGKDILFFWEDFWMTLYTFLLISAAFALLLIFVNYAPLRPETRSVRVEILRVKMKYRKRGPRYPAALIRYDQQEKWLGFPVEQKPQVFAADSLLLEIRSGNLGYPYAESIALISPTDR